MAGGEEPVEGTWAAGDNGVILTLDGNRYILTEAGDIMVMDQSLFFLSREPEKAGLREVVEFIESGVIPEGFTEQEMADRAQVAFGAVLLALFPPEEPVDPQLLLMLHEDLSIISSGQPDRAMP